MRWVGIDEAGYGPNLGPLVMSAVIAEGPDGADPDVWRDLAATVSRAGRGGGDGSDARRLWVDDSKVILKGGKGRDRLEAAAMALVGAVAGTPVTSYRSLLEAVGGGTFQDIELDRWLEDPDPAWPRPESLALSARLDSPTPLHGAAWRIVGARSVVVGPSRFNAGLARSGSKARVHFDAFASLILDLWGRAADGVTTRVRGDKHGGRHFYYEPLLETFPDAWIDRGREGAAESRYNVRSGPRRLELSFLPRADADDGLVALASVLSKSIRETWMDLFNRYWIARIPDLRPTAGYPVDAARFRDAIGPGCREMGLALEEWWRLK